MTTYVWRWGSPARESKWSNAVAMRPVTSTCATAVPGGCARPRCYNLAFHERNHLRNRTMMRFPDECLYSGIGDCPHH